MKEFNESTERQLSVKELEKLIFISFMHSQGDQMLQVNLVRWFTAYYGAQGEERFDEAYSNFSNNGFSQNNTFRLAEKRLHTATHSDANDGTDLGKIKESAMWDQMEYVLGLIGERNKSNLTDPKLLKEIIGTILDQDLLYLKNGRPNRKDSASSDTLADPYFSFSVHYLLRQNKTSNEAMDFLYKKLLTVIDDTGIVSKLNDVIVLYNVHHPDNPFNRSSLE